MILYQLVAANGASRGKGMQGTLKGVRGGTSPGQKPFGPNPGE